MREFLKNNPTAVIMIFIIIALCIIFTTAIYQGSTTKRYYIENGYEQIQMEHSVSWLWQKN